MINFAEVKEEGRQLSWVGYGISENVVFTSIDLGQTSTGTPRIEMKIKFEGAEDSSSTNLYLFLSEKALPIAMSQILQIQKRLSKESLLRSAKFNSNEDLVNFLRQNWIGEGKKFRLKLKGEEYIGVDKEGNEMVKTRVGLPTRFFIESMNHFSDEKPVMDASNTSLRFSKGDKYDYKKLEGADVQTLGERPYTEANGSDLPF